MRDLDVRVALHEVIPERHGPDHFLINELGLCQGATRIDVAVVDEALFGYEIKSERDTLDRLPSQQEMYGKTLEFVTIVCGVNHLSRVKHAVPEWWGIELATVSADASASAVDISCVRRGARNSTIDPYSMAQLLWKDEALKLLEERGLDRGVRSKPRHVLWERLAENLSTDELSRYTRNAFRRRRSWRVAPLPA